MMDDLSFDVFLSHNSQDKLMVEALARRLEDEAQLKPWLDKWHLVPGEAWQEELERALDRSSTCAVFIGPSNVSPWEHEEMRSALDRRVHEAKFRVVPVLLPGASIPERGAMPRFLSRLTWVDFRGAEGIHEAAAFHRLVAGIRGVPPGREIRDMPAAISTICPYQGLQAFDESRAAFFFGREAMTQHLVEAVRTSRFLAVLGPSGSGKSSVVRAGLLPQLRQGVLPQSQHWRYLVFTPNTQPVQALAVNLARAQHQTETPQRVMQLLDLLSSDERALHLQVRLALADQPASARFCLVIDQFEEIFTLCQDRSEREQFVETLRYAATIAGGQTLVIITMRADFIPRATEYTALAEILSANQFLVSPMDRVDLQRAISEPALRTGVRLEAGLVEAILEDVDAQPGALPLMQDALVQLWQQCHRHNVITLQDYRDIGSVHGALAKRADELFESFEDEQQQIARRIILRLTQPGDHIEDTRRRATLQELLTRDEERPAVEHVVRRFVDAHLLVISNDQLDVAHEALIRGWPRLRQWIDENRAGLRVHRRITEAAEEWVRLGCDEGALWRGARFAQAQEWRATYEEDLNDSERVFLDTSFDLQRREEEEKSEQQRRDLEHARALAQAEHQRAEVQARTAKRLRQRSLWLLAVLLLALAAAVFAALERQYAMQQSRMAMSNQLAAQALNHSYSALDVAYLLSLEAYRQAPTAAAQKSIRTVAESSPHLLAFLHGHETAVWGVTFSPDGRVLASGDRSGTICLWQMSQHPSCHPGLSGHTAAVWGLAFSPDGRWLASGSRDETVRLWDVATGQALGEPLTGHTAGIWGVAFSPDAMLLASGSEDNTIRLWDIATGQALGEPLTGHTAAVTSVAFHPDGKRLASGSRDGTIRLWDVTSRASLAVMPTKHSAGIWSVVFSPDGTLLASSSEDTTIRLWEVSTGQALGAPLTGHTDDVWRVAFSPDGRLLASSSEDTTIRLWEVSTGQALGAPLTGHTSIVWDVAFSPDGNRLASGSEDETVRLWNVTAAHRPDQPLKGHTDNVWAVAFNPVKTHGLILASGGEDATIRLWDVATGQPLSLPMRGHTGGIRAVAFSPDGTLVASGSEDATVRLWEVATGQPFRPPLLGHRGKIWSVAFSPDGRLLATSSRDKTIILWDVTTGSLWAQLTGHASDVWSIAFNHNGSKLVSGDGNGVVRLWDVAERKAIDPPLLGHKSDVYDVVFSPDGSLVASASDDRTVWLWDVATHRAVYEPFRGHAAGVWSVAFSPDGNMVASSGEDGTIRLWQVTWQTMDPPFASYTILVPHASDNITALWRVAFSSDGQLLATGGVDGAVRLWDVTRYQVLAPPLSGPQARVWRQTTNGFEDWSVDFVAWQERACQTANRNFTCAEWKSYMGDQPYRLTCPELPEPFCLEALEQKLLTQ